MASTPLLSHFNEPRSRRFSDDVFSRPWPIAEPKPAAENRQLDKCPFCEQRLPQTRTSISSLFFGGVRRLVSAIWMIVAAILRCVRLIVAAVFWCVGLVGYCCRSIAVWIAHPDDRRFFNGKRNLSPNRN